MEIDNHSKKSLRRSSNSHISISDADSIASQAESFHSPLRFDSPLRSDDPYFQHQDDHPSNNNTKTLISIDKHHSSVPSPGKSNFPASSPTAGGGRGWRPWPHSEKPNSDLAVRGTSPVVVGINRMVREEVPPGVKKVGPGGVGLEEGYGGGGGGGGLAEEGGGEWRSKGPTSGRTSVANKAALVLRVFEVIVCVISFSIMANDKTKGWSGDSFDRYIEYRYCLAVNVIGFVYSAFQSFDLAYYLGTKKYFISHHLRYHFDFSMDQILAYLLMSASSSGATRVVDWISNWGKDEFTLMATASIAVSFLAFVAFALSSLISGYNLCNRDST